MPAVAISGLTIYQCSTKLNDTAFCHPKKEKYNKAYAQAKYCSSTLYQIAYTGNKRIRVRENRQRAYRYATHFLIICGGYYTNDKLGLSNQALAQSQTF